ncbi:hypothetical protein ACJW30_11G165800 [Castanea mollissima]
MRLACNQFDQCVGGFVFETLLLGSVSKQSWLKKSFRPHYTLCLKSQLFDQPLCYSLMMDGCIHNNWSLPSSTLICWILAEMVTFAEFGDLASAIPIRDIWKQKHHKAIRDMWIPSPLVWKCTKGQDSFLIRCLSRMSFQPKIMLCKDIQALSLALQQMGRAHDHF